MFFQTLVISDSCKMTKREFRSVNKQDVAMSTLFPRGKTTKRSDQCRLGSHLYTKKVAIGVKYWNDGGSKLQALLLKNALSYEAAIGQQVIALLHLILSKGLMKGCAAAGHITTEGVHRCLNNVLGLQHFGVTLDQVKAVEVTGTCGSAKLLYRNRFRELKKFQLGNYIDFHLTKEEDLMVWVDKLSFCQPYKTYVQAWFSETKTNLMKYAPHFMSDQGWKTVQENPKCLLHLKLGMNLLTHHGSTISAHEDNASALPALLTSTNAAGHNSVWTDGSLFLAEGGIEIPYGGRDIVLLNGS